jgi:thiol-disulfide isomerase/thioredoxin
MKMRIFSVIVDVITGLVALAIFLVADGYLHVAADLRTAIISLAVLYLGAGLVRGRGPSAWLKGLLVGGGAALVLLALGLTEIHHTILAVLVVTAVLFAMLGARARLFWAQGSPGQASLTILTPLAALAIIVLTTIPQLAARAATRETAAAVPPFAVSRPDGSVVSSADWHGRVVVIDYWATWCPACRREMPELEKLYRQYQGNSNVVFWAIDVQKNGETPQKATAFMRNAGYTLPIAIDSRNSAESLAGRLGFDGFPALMVLDRAGRARLVHIGYDGSEHLQGNLSKEIDALVSESL